MDRDLVILVAALGIWLLAKGRGSSSASGSLGGSAGPNSALSPDVATALTMLQGLPSDQSPAGIGQQQNMIATSPGFTLFSPTPLFPAN